MTVWLRRRAGALVCGALFRLARLAVAVFDR